MRNTNVIISFHLADYSNDYFNVNDGLIDRVSNVDESILDTPVDDSKLGNN